MAYRPGIDPDRRKGPDRLIHSLKWLAIGGWLLMLAALIVLGLAKPEEVTFYDRHFNIARDTNWNYSLRSIIFYMMILGFSVSVLGLTINLKRLRRRDDEYRISLILMGFISLLGIIIYLLST